MGFKPKYKSYVAISDLPAEKRQALLSCSHAYLLTHLLGVDYIRKSLGYCLIAFIRLIHDAGLSLHRDTYHSILRGQVHTLSFLQVTNACRLLGFHPADCYQIGLAVQRGEQPDLSRYGFPSERLAAERAMRKEQYKAEQAAKRAARKKAKG